MAPQQRWKCYKHRNYLKFVKQHPDEKAHKLKMLSSKASFITFIQACEGCCEASSEKDIAITISKSHNVQTFQKELATESFLSEKPHYHGLMKNWIDDTQGASAHDVMPLMKPCLLPCQQDRCCCCPLIQYPPLEQTANNLAILNKKWHSGTAVFHSMPESNAVQTV